MFENLPGHIGNLGAYYAGQVVIGLLASGRLPKTHTPADRDELAKEAFGIADAMVREWRARATPKVARKLKPGAA
ncbi:MAG: hypothetical protein L0Z62_05685 [Gemmataceae bacterium]|nr:hypothetical protein [Gemmataceae bacterium]